MGDVMRVGDLHRILGQRMENDPRAKGHHVRVVTADGGGYMNRPSVGISEVQKGFDWGDGNIFFVPDMPMKKCGE